MTASGRTPGGSKPPPRIPADGGLPRLSESGSPRGRTWRGVPEALGTRTVSRPCGCAAARPANECTGNTNQYWQYILIHKLEMRHCRAGQSCSTYRRRIPHTATDSDPARRRRRDARLTRTRVPGRGRAQSRRGGLSGHVTRTVSGAGPCLTRTRALARRGPLAAKESEPRGHTPGRPPARSTGRGPRAEPHRWDRATALRPSSACRDARLTCAARVLRGGPTPGLGADSDPVPGGGRRSAVGCSPAAPTCAGGRARPVSEAHWQAGPAGAASRPAAGWGRIQSSARRRGGAGPAPLHSGAAFGAKFTPRRLAPSAAAPRTQCCSAWQRGWVFGSWKRRQRAPPARGGSLRHRLLRARPDPSPASPRPTPP